MIDGREPIGTSMEVWGVAVSNSVNPVGRRNCAYRLLDGVDLTWPGLGNALADVRRSGFLIQYSIDDEGEVASAMLETRLRQIGYDYEGVKDDAEAETEIAVVFRRVDEQ